MNSEEGFFPSFDQTKLYYRAWIQPSQISAFLIHGYGDHSSRYQDFIAEVQDLPISWFAFDLRGQGKSEGVRVDAKEFEDFVRDAKAFKEFVNQKFSNSSQKMILVGHSLGGLIAVRLMELSQNQFQGLILTSPCFQTAGISWWAPVRWFAEKLSALFPNLVLINFVRPRFLFKNSDKMQAYLSDKLIERRITARLGNYIIKACQAAQSAKVKLGCPLLVLASGDDRIVSLEATRKWFANVTASSKELKIYPKLYHEIFNESDHAEPLADLRQFLKRLI